MEFLHEHLGLSCKRSTSVSCITVSSASSASLSITMTSLSSRFCRLLDSWNQLIGASSASFFNTKGLKALSKSDVELVEDPATGSLEGEPFVDVDAEAFGLAKKLAMRERDLF